MHIRRIARELQRDLQHNHLEVAVMEAPDKRHYCHRVRVVQGQNPSWYREFCTRFESQRKDKHKWKCFKTAIKRALVCSALSRLAKGVQWRRCYDRRVLELCQEEYQKEMAEIPF